MADKVLIVDDDVDCLQLTGELLLEWDYRVITAASGAVAVEKAKRERNCLPLWVDQGDGGVVGSTKD